MKRLPLTLAFAFLVLCSPRIFAQVDCSTIPQEEILHCDGPGGQNVGNIIGLSLQRGDIYNCYRKPRIVITRSTGAQDVYPIMSSQWQYTTGNQGITTTFSGGTPATFTMNSTPAFSPLAGSINLGGNTITFRTCGNQRTSAYYWTQSSQNRLEAFSCPFTRMPRQCPGTGYNP